MAETAAKTETLAEKAGEIARLEQSFKLFTETTRGLETAFDKLSRRAQRIDLELKRTNDDLRDKVDELEAVSRNRMSILEALPSGVVVLDTGRFVSCVNPAAERILGRRAAEILGRAADAVVGATGDPLLLPENEAEHGRRQRQVERDVVTLDGSRRRIAITVSALPDGGELQVLNDLTVVTRLREQIGRLDTLAALGEMAAGVAHEIRNPLNGIDGFAGLMARAVEEDSPSTNKLSRYAENIRRGVREVNDIVSNLLTFASPETISLSPVDVVPLVSGVVDELQRFGPGSGCRPEFVNEAGSTATIPGDPVKLKIVVTNLVRNAIEAAGSRGQVLVRLARCENSGRTLIEVEDDGGGLPDEVRSRLFRPFTTTKASGTGLGLAIANKFASLHGGEIGFEDIEGGTRFCVSLPASNGGAA